jgi:NADH:ubiquinone oxidoreductase subunit 6 (subunit J)
MICFFIFQLQVLSEFDLFYIFESRLSNYTYHEIFGTNIIELGSYLYLEYPVIVILSGVILFFALIAAVFLTIDHAKPPV